MIKPLDLSRLGELQELVRHCHPLRRILPPAWHFAHPTLVADDNGYVGYTSFSISEFSGPVMCLFDTGVREDYRGKGLAAKLMAERIKIAKSLDIQTLIGAVRPDNTPMIRLLERFGFHACQYVKGYYQDEEIPRDGVIYTASMANITLPEEK